MVQLGVKILRRFALTSLALSEHFDPALKFGGSLGSLFQLANERQELRQLVLDQFLVEQFLLPAFILEGFLVAFTILFPASIHVDSPFAIQS